MKVFSFLVFSLVLLLSCTGERTRRKEITGAWKVITKASSDSNYLDFAIPDTLISNSCTLVTALNKKVEVEYLFKERNKATVIEKHLEQLLDISSAQDCIPVLRDTAYTNEFEATWDIEGKENLLVIYNNRVENLVIREFSKTAMTWSQDINVTGGIVSFKGVVTFTLEKR